MPLGNCQFGPLTELPFAVQLLTPIQVARCIVQGWPYTPDTLAICSWVAAEDGDAGALAVLTAPNRAGTSGGGGAAWAPSSSQAGFTASDHNRAGRGESRACCHHAMLGLELSAVSICSVYFIVSECCLNETYTQTTLRHNEVNTTNADSRKSLCQWRTCECILDAVLYSPVLSGQDGYVRLPVLDCALY